ASNVVPSPWVDSPSITTRASPTALPKATRSEKSSSAGSIERNTSACLSSQATRLARVAGSTEASTADRAVQAVAKPAPGTASVAAADRKERRFNIDAPPDEARGE